MTTRKRRIAAKVGAVQQELRRQIVEGRFGPGDQLPKRGELEQHFNVSPLTLGRAMNRLATDGFIYAKTGQGTFVTDDPPHLTNYGVVFPHSPGTWNNYYESLHNATLAIQRSGARKISIYLGAEDQLYHESKERLIADVLAHRLAGLFFATPPHFHVGTPLMDEPRMARVTMGEYSKIPTIVLESLIPRALDHLVERGRRNIAFLVGPVNINHSMVRLFHEAMESRGLQSRSCWEHSVSPGSAPWAKNLVEMLFRSGNPDRPDALLIADDNLVPYATAGLVAAGVRAPTQVDVVAHCNFPVITPSVVPARRIGYDCRVILEHAFAVIDAQRRGEALPATSCVAACFEEDFYGNRQPPEYAK